MTEGSNPNNPDQDLEAARQRGRWLSDEEQAELDRQNQQIQLSQEPVSYTHLRAHETR